MTVYEAIYGRYSVRKYQKEGLGDSQLEHIHHFMENVTPLEDKIPFTYEIVCLEQMPGRFTRGYRVHAPHYFVLYSPEVDNAR